jgi:hypothetical protein
VLDHTVLADESFATDVTGKRFFTGVKTHVTPEISLVVKLLGTDVTLVRFVSSMLGQVLLK